MKTFLEHPKRVRDYALHKALVACKNKLPELGAIDTEIKLEAIIERSYLEIEKVLRENDK